MVLMRRLLIDAQSQFRKMMSDNQALASRIDQDIQLAHHQVSELRAELADTIQRIRDICSDTFVMAGNVITTCMPPTSTTNTTVVSNAEGHWLKEAKEIAPVTSSSMKVARQVTSATIADKGGTQNPDIDKPHTPKSQSEMVHSPKSQSGMVHSPKSQSGSPKSRSSVVQCPKYGIKIGEIVNGSSPDQYHKKVTSYTEQTYGKVLPQNGNSTKSVLSSRDSLTHSTESEKPESLTESSEASEEISVSKHSRVHRRERRSLKGSDVHRSLLDLKSQQSSLKLNDSKTELQRSESESNQNSAPECDLSISGSPFKEDSCKELDPTLPLKSSSKVIESDGSKGDDFNKDYHRSSPPVKDDSNAQCFPFSKETQSGSIYLPTNGHRYKPKTKSDPLDKRCDNSAQEFSVLSSPSCVMKHKTGVSKLQLGICNWDNTQFESDKYAGSWYKAQDSSSSKNFVDESSSKEDTPESPDGPPSKFCDQRPIRDENIGGRYVVFNSKEIQRPPCREFPTTIGEGYRDQHQPESLKNSLTTEQKDASDKRPGLEKVGQTTNGHVKDSSHGRKSENMEYLSQSDASKPHQDDTSSTQSEMEALKIKNSALLRDLEEIMESRDEKAKENAVLAARMDQMDKELKHAKEALSALKQDRKRLKAEKFDLLTQMKQLYSTLEDKEAELREFIRNYEQKMKESDENMKMMSKDREEMEQEKWSILKRARDEAERAVLLCTQLGLKDAQIKELQEELGMMQDKQQTSPSNGQSNGFGSPGSISYRTANGIESRGTPTPGSDPPSYAGTPTATPLYADPLSPRKGQMVQHISPDHRPSLLSRSAEDIFNPGRISEINSIKKKSKKGTWGSISRVFSRNKKRKPLDPQLFENNRYSWSPKDNSSLSPYSEENYVQKLRLLEETHGTPMQHWRAATVLAWLEITMDMPQYGAACAENVKSGKLLLELSDSELEEGLGVTNAIHRRKLRLAIEEHRQPSLCRYPKICLMTHAWVVEEWLQTIALTCYLPSFSEHLVDGRVLDTLIKKDLEKHFGISRKFHQLSIMHAVQLLRMLSFDRQILNQRRMNSENMDIDPLVWTNQRLIKWAAGMDLGEYADNLRNTGVHGALAVLEPSFTADTIATALGIPTSKNIIRRHLTTEWQNLIQPARLSLESECMVSGKSKSEKRLASGSSSISLVSQGRSSSSIMPSYARRTLDRYDRRRSSWRESLRSLTSKKTPTNPTTSAERPHVLPLSPKLNSGRHRRTFSSHSDVETLTVTPV